MQALSGRSSVQGTAVPRPARLLAGARRSLSRVHASAGQGFGDNKQKQQQRPREEEAGDASAPSTSAAASGIDVDAALARRRNRRRVEAKVKVESAAVAQATGVAPQTEIGEAETAAVQALAGFFGILLVEGLVLAASGFLPESWDAVVQDYLYPSYSPQMLAFLGASSLYGLWKTGKLPGQKQL